MNAVRVIKTIESTNVYELASYIGQKVEIIIFPLSNAKTERMSWSMPLINGTVVRLN